ncbi:MAG: oligopeptide transporter, OPT family [Candidatus Kapabacteria bacterium]|nr:oligopeptide transporter, OPT family [Candidatus Kapabacteria bacterium]
MTEKDLKSIDVQLPENAYRELNVGEVYRPILAPEYYFAEVTPYSIIMGLILAIVFTAASAYSGLKIGQVMEAAIPISILAIGFSKAFKRKRALGQNVIIQSIGASSGVIVAGTIFTIPAFFILSLSIDYFTIMLATLLGGILGIALVIPFRKYFTTEMHGKLPYPEATAITEILIAGEKEDTNQSKILLISGLIGGVYDFIITSLGWWQEVITTKMFPIGQAIVDKSKIVLKLDTLSMIFGLGYIIGLEYSTIIALGSLLSWLVLVPLINEIGNIVVGIALNPIAKMSAEEIFKNYVKSIGSGAIAMAGIIGIIKSGSIIKGSLKVAFKELFGNQNNDSNLRTQKDIKFVFVLSLILSSLLAFAIFFTGVYHLSIANALVAVGIIFVISFLFTNVAANATALVGTNPVSGMTLMTLIVTSLVLSMLGFQNKTGIALALIIGAAVCTALSVAGGFITDLKVGYWIGNTPKNQQSYKLLGILVSAATAAGVVLLLNSAYGFDTNIPGHLAAPQANAMAGLIEPLLSPKAFVNWNLYLIGALIAIIMNFLKISPLAFALGMYLPIELNTPLVVGGLIAYFAKKSTTDKIKSEERHNKGTLIASGFIAGGALFGVIGAILKLILNSKGIDLYNYTWSNTFQAEWLGLGMFIIISIYVYWQTTKD